MIHAKISVEQDVFPPYTTSFLRVLVMFSLNYSDICTRMVQMMTKYT